MKNFYNVLNIQETATTAEVKTAHRRLARANHPDLNPGNKAKEERFKEIQAAYEVLGDSARRAAYDDQLRADRAAEAFRADMERRAAAARAEAERRAAAEAAAWARPFVSQAPPPHRPVANQASAGGTDLGSVLAGIAGVGLVAMAFAALAGGGRSRSSWDPSVQRYRGKDGRFRSS